MPASAPLVPSHAIGSSGAGSSGAELAGVVQELRTAQCRRDDLAAELTALEEATAEGPDDEHDPDGCTVGYERARVGALLSRARADIAGLHLALGRLDAGTYGRCQACGETIAAERLVALPSTATCVGCARRCPESRTSL